MFIPGAEQRTEEIYRLCVELQSFGEQKVREYNRQIIVLKNYVVSKKLCKKKDFTPPSIPPKFSWWDPSACISVIFGNYETKGINLNGNLRKLHTEVRKQIDLY